MIECRNDGTSVFRCNKYKNIMQLKQNVRVYVYVFFFSYGTFERRLHHSNWIIIFSRDIYCSQNKLFHRFIFWPIKVTDMLFFFFFRVLSDGFSLWNVNLNSCCSFTMKLPKKQFYVLFIQTSTYSLILFYLFFFFVFCKNNIKPVLCKIKLQLKKSRETTSVDE